MEPGALLESDTEPRVREVVMPLRSRVAPLKTKDAWPPVAVPVKTTLAPAPLVTEALPAEELLEKDRVPLLEMIGLVVPVIPTPERFKLLLESINRL